MREVLLIIVVAIIGMTSLLRPTIGIFGYVWFALMRPDFMAWSAGKLNFSFFLAVCLILGTVFQHLPRVPITWLTNPFCRWLILLQFPMWLSTQHALIPAVAWDSYNLFLRTVIMALWIPTLIRTVDDMRKLMLVTGFSLGFWGLWHGATGMLRGGVEIHQGIGGFMVENNSMAIGLAMVVPICWSIVKSVNVPLIRFFYLAMTIGCIATVIMTFSRGAAIALAVGLLMIVLKQKNKMIVFVGLLVLSLPAFLMMRKSYTERLSTLTDIEDESSAYSRVEQIRAGISMWKDYPLLGVGLGAMNFIAISEPYFQRENRNEVHNSFVQMLVHCGIFAFLIYVGMLLHSVFWLGRSAKRLRKTDPALAAFPEAIQISIVTFMVASIAHPRATFDFTYMLIMYGAAWWGIERNLRKKAAVHASQVTVIPAGKWALPQPT